MQLTEDSPVGTPALAQKPNTGGQIKPSEQKQNNKAYIDHGKCCIELMTMAGGAAVDRDVFHTLIEEFKMGIDKMLGNGGKKQEPFSEEIPPIENESIPF